MKENIRTFVYRFEFPDRGPEEFTIHLDRNSAEILPPEIPSLPPWTELSFLTCPHCPLDTETVSHCPLAVSIAGIINKFDALASYQETAITVISENRTYSCETSVQSALSALLGLVIATSGCPHTAFLRPMAHFHLPVATGEETIYRVAGTYLIGQFFRKTEGKPAQLDLSGLQCLYENVEKVNSCTADRIRTVATKDAPVNAIIVLDSLAKSMSMAIEKELNDIRPLWSAYLS